MKIILNQSYMNLGEIGDVLEVKPGYARNFLIPQGIAKRATLANLRVLQDQAKKLEAQKATDRSSAQGLLKQLEGVTIKILKKVSEDGRLYGSVTTKEVESAFSDKKILVDRRQIVLGQAIKMLGDYSIMVKLFGGLKAMVPLKVESDGTTKLAVAPTYTDASSETAEA
jgi:large subunit ribosomal protein L9